jgi:insulysin
LTDHRCQALSPNDIPELFLPPPNEFIPVNLEVGKRDAEQPLKRPHLIRETSLSRLWHKKDDRFWVPKATVIVEMRSPVANASPLASVLTSLYSDLVRDALNEFTYAAELAGLNYNFSPATHGLYTTMSGYNDKLATLTHHVLEKVKNLSIDPKRLEVMKEQSKRDWENFSLSQSYQLSDYYARYILTHKQWTVQEKLQELPNATPETLKQHIDDMLSQMHLRILVNGNLYKDEAIKIAEMAEANLGVCTTALTELDDLSLILPPASNSTWALDSPNPNQPNSALSFYLYLGSGLDPRHRVISSLLAQILSEPAFNVLRTQEQLGYIVHCSLWNQAGGTHKGIRIIVQSEKAPNFLEGRVEEFLLSMRQSIQEMPEDVFSEQKVGLEKKWREADKNLAEETNRFWAHIGTGLNDFLRRENDADLLQNVTKQEILDLFSSHVDPSSTSRSKLSVHMRSTKPKPKYVSHAAADIFRTLLQSQGKIKSQASPSDIAHQSSVLLTDFLQSWSAILTEGGLSKDSLSVVLGQLGPILEEHPAIENVPEPPQPGVTYLDDPARFKESLKISEPPMPVVEWGDLPVSRL